MFYTDDLCVKWTQILLPPASLEQELPTTQSASESVHNFRYEITNIVQGKDHRLLLVVGPCSIHDTGAAREYAQLLRRVMEEHSRELCIVMRVYFEKPRTTIGWNGFINDPYLDGSFRINDGLRLARQLLLDLAKMGVPAATEFLDTITPQYIAGLISWGAIGARTTESQIHRELVSALPHPVGFKNGTSGDVQGAIEAVECAAHPHCFLAQNRRGESAIFATAGNPNCHVILRGGRGIVNYKADSVNAVCSALTRAALSARIMIDCSHANSGKDYKRQISVCQDVSTQISRGEKRIIGVMLESNLISGAQKLLPGQKLVYGQSITDSCLGWQETVALIGELAEAVRTGRQGAGVHSGK